MAPVALIAAAQGSIYACTLIALFLGKACCCGGNLDESKMRDALGQGLRVYSAFAVSPKELLDPAVAALRVQGVQHSGDMLFGAFRRQRTRQMFLMDTNNLIERFF